MLENKGPKVVIKQKVLHGSERDGLLQRVATVYDGDIEYRVLAPPQAEGPTLEWITHLTIRKPAGVKTEEVVEDARRIFVLKILERELKKQGRDANRAEGMNPDGQHCDAQICLKGHVLHCDGMPFDSEAY